MAGKKANEIILELKAENKDLSDKIKKVTGDLDKLEAKTQKTTNSMGGAFGKLKGLIAGYLGVEAIKHLVNLAGEIDSVESSFYNLASGAKDGADGLLEAMQKASQGTVDSTSIMKNANSAILTLGEEVADKLPKLMEIALATSKTTGKSTEETFNQLVSAVQSGNGKMLRSVGLSTAQVDIYVKEYAKSLGLTANQLTETEKKQAYLNAVLQAGEGAIKRVAGEGLSFGQKLQKIKVISGDFIDNLAKKLTPDLDKLADSFLDASESGGAFEAVMSAVAKAASIVIRSLSTVIQLMSKASNWGALSAAEKYQEKATTALAVMEEEYKKRYGVMWESVLKGNAAHKAELDALEKNRAAVKHYGEEVEKFGGKNDDINEKIKKIWEDSDKANEKLNANRRNRGRQTAEAELIDVDAVYQREQQNSQERIKAYEEMYQWKMAEIELNAMTYQQMLMMKDKYEMDGYTVQEAWEKKKLLLHQTSVNKAKQSEVEYTRAKMGLDRMEYQNAKEVFAQSSTLMGSKNKFLFNMGKGLAYASAVMSAAESVAKVWSVWSAYPPIAAAFTAITLAATGVQIAKIKETKLPSYQRGRLPSFADGYYPANHFPAMIGADEAVINGRSTAANAAVLKYMNDNPGQRVGGGMTVHQTNNFSGNVMNEDFVNNQVIPNLERQARYQGKQLFAERR
jgi:hypothetical protein